MTMITPSYLGETIEYSSLHACRSTLEDPTNSKSDSGPKRRPIPHTPRTCTWLPDQHVKAESSLQT